MATSTIAAGAGPTDILSATINLPRERRLSLVALTSLVFFTTCGGAYGVEPLVGAVGPGLAVLFLVVTPFVWSLPISLMVAELTTFLPEEGGYYVWVRNALGPFWGVQEGVWTMSCCVALLAMFPVLFVSYFTYFFPMLAPSAHDAHPVLGAFLRWLLAFLVTVTGMAVNLRGSREVGSSAKLGATIVLGAFLMLILSWILWGPSAGMTLGIVRSDFASHRQGALLLGLSYVVFNYSGWDNISTYAAEVDRPQRNYPLAIGIALMVVILIYLLPVLAGVSVTSDPQIWSADAGWPAVARVLGGRWLGALLAMAGLVSTWGMFNAQLLYVSRLPFVMACDGWFPRALANVSPGTAVPKMAIICFCALTAVFVALPLGSLAVIQCLTYAAALTLEFLALILLRIRRPTAAHGFRVPGGWWGMAYVCLTPFAFAILVVYATLRDWRSFPGQLVVVAAAAAAGIILYVWRRRTASAISAKIATASES
ncbi:MAG TPA: APC family permease [Candidatus Acidoferrum sp.]|nr:APC family permease [Candidatus Acidoferrum sp.]